MSDVNVGSATFFVRGNTAHGTNAVNQFTGSLSQLERATATNWWGLQNLGMAFAALPAAVGVGVAAAVKSSIAWQDAMADVERTTGLAGQQLSDLEEDLFEIGRNKPVATVEIAGIAEAAGALGVAETDFAAFTAVVADLDATTDLTADSASTNLARIAAMTGVTGAGFDNLGSSIMQTGISTAATETDIVNLANRISGVAGVVGLTADEVVALAAATRSAGVQSEAGGTAIQKTFLDIYTAVKEGGDQLELWAKVAGQSSEQFRTAFEQDAAGAFLGVVQGLERLSSSGVNIVGVLEELGITEQRQLRTLFQLAQAEGSVTNENVRLSKILGISNAAFEDGNTLQEAAKKRYQTTGAQIQILRNQLFELGTVIGDVFIRPMSLAVGWLGNFINGLRVLPGPIKVIVGSFIGLSTVIMGLIAAALLIGARIIIAVGAIKQLQMAAIGGSSGAGQLAVALDRAAVANRNFTVSAQAASLAALRQQQVMLAAANAFSFMAGGVQSGSQILNNYNAGVHGAATGTSRLTTWAMRGAKGIGYLTAAMTLLTIATTIYGQKQAEAAAKLAKAQEPNKQLTKLLRDQSGEADKNAAAWTRNAIQKAKIADSAKKLGFSEKQLSEIIQGTASDKTYENFTRRVSRANDDGSDSARRLGQEVVNLQKSYAGSVQEAGVLVGANGQIIGSNDELIDSFGDVGKAADEERDRLAGIAQAHLDYVNSQMDLLQANMDLRDAERELASAREAAEKRAEAIADAELDLRRARRSQAAALRDLEEAERDVNRARRESAEKVKDAEEDLQDARDRHSDLIDSIHEKEEELAKLRRGPEIEELEKATLALAKAQDKLGDSHQAVADAEWQLQYLREEGASARDIQDAEEALSDARLDVQEATQDVNDAENELQELRDGTERAERIAELEEEIARARRDALRSTRDIQDRERALAEARSRHAANTDYIEAQDRLVEAQGRVQDAIDETKEKELELANLRRGSLAEEAEQKQLDYTRALFAVAEANAEARKQQMLMRGETVDAGDEARILAEELERVAASAPDQASRKALQDYANILRGAPAVPDGGGGGDLPPMDMDTGAAVGGLDELNGKLDELQENIEETPSIWEFILGGLGGGAGVGGLAGGAIGMAIGGPIGAIVGVILGSIIGGLIEKFWPQITGFFKSIGKWIVGPGKNIMLGALLSFFLGPLGLVIGLFHEQIWEAMKDMWGVIERFFTETLPRWGSTLWSFFSAIPGTIGRVVPIVLGAIGRFIGRIISTLVGAGARVSNAVIGWFTRLPGNIWRAAAGVFSTVYRLGENVISNIVNGIGRMVRNLWSFFWNLPNNIWNAVSGLWRTMGNIGHDIVVGLWNGLVGMGRWLWDRIWDWIRDVIPGPIRRVLGIDSPSKLMMGYGEDVVKGLAMGIEANKRMVSVASEDLAKAAYIKPGGVDWSALTGTPSPVAAYAAGGFGDAGGGNTTVINEGDFNLEAHTDADPEEIIGEWAFQKRVRLNR